MPFWACDLVAWPTQFKCESVITFLRVKRAYCSRAKAALKVRHALSVNLAGPTVYFGANRTFDALRRFRSIGGMSITEPYVKLQTRFCLVVDRTQVDRIQGRECNSPAAPRL